MALLECRGLTKRYGSTLALDQVNLTIEPGRIVGLLGPNGSGKTTLIKTIMGLLTPTEGEIFINGMTPGKAAKAIISYLPERNALPLWMNLNQLMAFYEDFYPDFDRASAIDMLTHLSLSLRQPLRQLSKGNREKIQLILTMSRNARLYLLDEPIGGVDPATRDYILNTIIGNFRPESSVLISTHLIADVEPVLDDVIFLNRGQVYLQKSADELREEEGRSVDALFREVFKC